jgi:hypothetical protein
MFLSKIWFVLVALLAGVALTAAFVAPRPADRRIEQLEGQRLDRAQYAAEQQLKTNARTWIDHVAKLARDAAISESLDSASRNAGEARMLHETVRNRLKTLVPDMAGTGLETVVAVDAKGRVVARLGDRESDWGESIGGLELVADALRGYLTDDVWGTGDKLRRMAAAPVLNKTRDKLVGAVYVGAETGKRLAEHWQKNLGMDIAILLKRQVVATTLSDADGAVTLGALPELIEQRKQEIADNKRTRAIALGEGKNRFLAVAAPFAGAAAEQDAYYVLLGKKEQASSPWALLSNTAAEDLAWRRFPWLGLLGALLLMLGMGLILQHHDVEAPLGRMRREVQRVAKGEIQKLEDTTFPGKFGGIARDINAALEHFTHAPSSTSRSDLSRKDLNQILDSGGPSDGKSFDVGGGTPGLAPPPAFIPPPPSPFGAPPPLGGAKPPAPPPGFSFERPAAGGVFPPAPPPAAPPPPPAAALAGGNSGPSARPPAQTLVGVGMSSLGGSPPAARVLPPAAGQARPPGGGGRTPSTELTPVVESRDGAGREPAIASDSALDPEEAHIREVFAEYVSVRKQCGESTAGLTVDKFRAKLAANREQLIAKYNCRTARFAVYVKDGKAAIKATPVRD